MRAMKIKICGLTRIQDIEVVNEGLPDYVGFVFAESRRKVCREQAEQMKKLLDKRIQAVGVFVDAQPEEIAGLCRDGIIDIIQLHGNESPAYLESLRNEVANPIIKAMQVQSTRQILESQEIACEYLLFDTFHKDSCGGSGTTFDHSLIPRTIKPFFLAGGLNAGNIRAAAECLPYCLDVSSGVETNGVKDRDKIRNLIDIVRSVR